MMRSRTLRWSAAGIAVAAVTSAMANGRGAGAHQTIVGGRAESAAVSISLRATEFRFRPGRARAQPGSVRLTILNRGRVRHALAIRVRGRTPRTRTVAPGRSTGLRVRLAAGRYRFWCPVDDHRALGMQGVLVVG